MGSGLSLTDKQVANIIKRDLKNIFNEKENEQNLNRYTGDGYEIFYDFSEEENLLKKIKEIDDFVKKSEALYYYYYDDDDKYSKNKRK
jgi:predicted component of type VI protein secretion system